MSRKRNNASPTNNPTNHRGILGALGKKQIVSWVVLCCFRSIKYPHSIENIGTGVLVTLFWASEMFDPEKSDTYFEKVSHE